MPQCVHYETTVPAHLRGLTAEGSSGEFVCLGRRMRTVTADGVVSGQGEGSV